MWGTGPASLRGKQEVLCSAPRDETPPAKLLTAAELFLKGQSRRQEAAIVWSCLPSALRGSARGTGHTSPVRFNNGFEVIKKSFFMAVTLQLV